jgi:DNA replication protein DnaC
MMQHPNDIMQEKQGPVLQRFSARTMADATWTCANCGVIAGKAITFTGSVRYVKSQCACQVTEVERKLYEEKRQKWIHEQRGRTFSWLGERWDDSALLEKTFDNFDQRAQPNAFHDVRSFITDMRGVLVLHGTWGTGKTHLLAALCNEIRQYERGSLFVTAPKLFSVIQTKIATHEDYSSILTSAMRTNLLVIDDVDKAKHSDFREEIYFEIIDERVKAGRPIAISTNRLDMLEQYVGGAVCSRLKVGQIDVPMLGVDYREIMDIA